MENPFETEIFKLRVPLRQGELTVAELRLRPPVLRDMLRTDGHDPNSIGYARALLSSLSGVPEIVLDNLVPEDWADLRIILAKQNMRFMGLVNLFDKDEDTEDPPDAAGNDAPSPSSSPPSAA
jgi:hypothetical protein